MNDVWRLVLDEAAFQFVLGRRRQRERLVLLKAFESLRADPIVTVEGLGKRYRLGASRSNERYTALRDVVSDKVASMSRRNGRPTSDLGHPTSAPASQDFWALKDVSFEVRRGEVLASCREAIPSGLDALRAGSELGEV